jgi:hypothetical protein
MWSVGIGEDKLFMGLVVVFDFYPYPQNKYYVKIIQNKLRRQIFNV